jgi:hypothetical protein
MKKIILFAVVALLFTACATQSRGYNYKAHHKRSANAKPSKCYLKHNQW